MRRARALGAARHVRLLVLDVDGVLTDGRLLYKEAGPADKLFHAQDGLGIKAAQAQGLHVAVISGLDSPVVARRMKELGVEDYQPGHRHKVGALQLMLDKHGLGWPQAAFLGDDWVDLAVMEKVGLPMTVPNSQAECRRLALWTSRLPGGHAATREAIRFILQAQGKLSAAVNSFLHPQV
ncbi:KdsC family phosphatase [Megalodesulfovibrio paquesii]